MLIAESAFSASNWRALSKDLWEWSWASARCKPRAATPRRSAAQRGITNGEFLMGEVEVHWPEILKRFDAAQTAVILDPPRTGCSGATLDWLRQSRPAQIIYVSCKSQ